MLSGRPPVSATRAKRPTGGAEVSKLFAKLRRGVKQPPSAAPTSTTVKSASTTGSAGKPASSYRPTWKDFQLAIDAVDQLKLQWPLFGSDRLSDQFYKLLDPVLHLDDFDFDMDESSHSGDASSQPLTVDPASSSGTEDNEHAAGFYSLSFNEMVTRYALRALVSPFAVDQVQSAVATALDDTSITAQPACQAMPSLESYAERAVALFGRGAGSLLQLRQASAFRLEAKDGGFVRPTATASSAKKNSGFGNGTGDSSGAFHQEAGRKMRALLDACHLALPRPFCGCCISPVRLYIVDSLVVGSGRPNHLPTVAKSSQQTYCLFNIGDVLYRPLPPGDRREDHFDVRAAYRGIKEREQSRSSLLKTQRVLRMGFYRRIYAVHAAVYAVVSWLWYRLSLRHKDFCLGVEKLEVAPVVLVANRDLGRLFTHVNTVYLELLLQRQRVYLHFV